MLVPFRPFAAAADQDRVLVQVVVVAFDDGVGGTADEVADTDEELNEQGHRVRLARRSEHAHELPGESVECFLRHRLRPVGVDRRFHLMLSGRRWRTVA